MSSRNEQEVDGFTCGSGQGETHLKVACEKRSSGSSLRACVGCGVSGAYKIGSCHWTGRVITFLSLYSFLSLSLLLLSIMVKVCVCGAAGGIGQPLSLLLKQSPLITHLSLYDIVNTPGVAADLRY